MIKEERGSKKRLKRRACLGKCFIKLTAFSISYIRERKGKEGVRSREEI